MSGLKKTNVANPSPRVIGQCSQKTREQRHSHLCHVGGDRVLELHRRLSTPNVFLQISRNKTVGNRLSIPPVDQKILRAVQWNKCFRRKSATDRDLGSIERKSIVAHDPRNFFDEVVFSSDVVSVARGFYSPTALDSLTAHPKRCENARYFCRRHLNPEHPL